MNQCTRQCVTMHMCRLLISVVILKSLETIGHILSSTIDGVQLSNGSSRVGHNYELTATAPPVLTTAVVMHSTHDSGVAQTTATPAVRTMATISGAKPDVEYTGVVMAEAVVVR